MGSATRLDVRTVGFLAADVFYLGEPIWRGWVERPLLAFFAAPAYTCVSLSPCFYLMDQFNGSLAVIVLTVPVLLFASWMLTGRWLEGRVKAGYTARVLAYTAVAVLIPCLWIVGSAWSPRLIDLVAQGSTANQVTISMETDVSDAGGTFDGEAP